MRAGVVFCALTALFAPDLMALTSIMDSATPCGHRVCTCCHGEVRVEGGACSSHTLTMIEGCEDEAKTGPSQAVYLLEAPTDLASFVILVSRVIPLHDNTLPWMSPPDSPPPRT